MMNFNRISSDNIDHPSKLVNGINDLNMIVYRAGVQQLVLEPQTYQGRNINTEANVFDFFSVQDPMNMVAI